MRESANQKKGRELTELLQNKINGKSLKLEKSDVISLFKLRYTPTYNDEGEIIAWVENGETVKDNHGTPVTIDSLVENFAKSYIAEPEGGRAKGNEKGRGAKSWSAFEDEMKQRGITAGSETYNREVHNRINSNSLELEV